MKKLLSIFGASLIVVFPSGTITAFSSSNLINQYQTNRPTLHTPVPYEDGLYFGIISQHIPTGWELPSFDFSGKLPVTIFNALLDPKWINYLSIILDEHYLHGSNHTPTQTDYINFTSNWCYQFLTNQFDNRFPPFTPPPEFITWSKRYGQQIYSGLKGVKSIQQFKIDFWKQDALLQIKKLLFEDATSTHLIFNSIWHQNTFAHIYGVCVAFRLILAYHLGKYTNNYNFELKLISPNPKPSY